MNQHKALCIHAIAESFYKIVSILNILSQYFLVQKSMPLGTTMRVQSCDHPFEIVKEILLH